MQWNFIKCANGTRYLQENTTVPLIRLFTKTLQILQQICMENVHLVYVAGIRTHNLHYMSLLT